MLYLDQECERESCEAPSLLKTSADTVTNDLCRSSGSILLTGSFRLCSKATQIFASQNPLQLSDDDDVDLYSQIAVDGTAASLQASLLKMCCLQVTLVLSTRCL